MYIYTYTCKHIYIHIHTNIYVRGIHTKLVLSCLSTNSMIFRNMHRNMYTRARRMCIDDAVWIVHVLHALAPALRSWAAQLNHPSDCGAVLVRPEFFFVKEPFFCMTLPQKRSENVGYLLFPAPLMCRYSCALVHALFPLFLGWRIPDLLAEDAV